MSVAKKLKYHEPGFMAVRKLNKEGGHTGAGSKKKWRVDATVLITWIILIALAFVFWLLIINLF